MHSFFDHQDSQQDHRKRCNKHIHGNRKKKKALTVRYMQDKKFNANSRKQLGARMPANILPIIDPLVAAGISHFDMQPAKIELIARPDFKFADNRNGYERGRTKLTSNSV